MKSLEVKLLTKEGDSKHSAQYQGSDVQVIDFCMHQNLDFFQGSIVKYICRDKGSRLKDLKKAKQYVDWLIEMEEDK